jgi:hypothetical protein
MKLIDAKTNNNKQNTSMTTISITKNNTTKKRKSRRRAMWIACGYIHIIFRARPATYNHPPYIQHVYAHMQHMHTCSACVLTLMFVHVLVCSWSHQQRASKRRWGNKAIRSEAKHRSQNKRHKNAFEQTFKTSNPLNNQTKRITNSSCSPSFQTSVWASIVCNTPYRAPHNYSNKPTNYDNIIPTHDNTRLCYSTTGTPWRNGGLTW